MMMENVRRCSRSYYVFFVWIVGLGIIGETLSVDVSMRKSLSFSKFQKKEGKKLTAEEAIGGSKARDGLVAKSIRDVVSSHADAIRFVDEHLSEEDRNKGRQLHEQLVGVDPSKCTSCIYIMERIKMGYQYQLPALCVEFYSLSSSSKAFAHCNEIIDVMSVWGPNIKSWLHDGCFKNEPYGAMSRITPCPSHVICAEMHDLSQKLLCPVPESDYKAPTDTKKMDKCTTCIYTIERIKQGHHRLLPSICNEVFSLSETGGPDAFKYCNDVLGSLAIWANNVRSWLHNGCYKSEKYGAMEKIQPCPSHVICSQIEYAKDKAFCDRPLADYKDK